MEKTDLKTIDFITKTYMEERYKINPTCYFYDLDKIRDNIRSIEKYAPEQLDLFFAMKANSNPIIMDVVNKEKFIYGVEIASYGELEKALKLYDPKQIIFTGPGKTEYELEQAIKSGIKLINVESVVEAIRVSRIAERLNISNVDILLRINVNYMITEAYENMAGKSTKMGIDECNYVSSYNEISKLKNITVKGIHVFSASGILDYTALIRSIMYIFKLVKAIEASVNKIDIIDFGGGIGIDYSNEGRIFDIENYCIELKKLIDEYAFNDKRIIMELGTYIVGNSGYYTSKIIDIKEVKGRKHIIIAGGVNHMGLPLEMRRKHPIEIIPMSEEVLYENQPKVLNELADTSGPLCMVTDKLSWDDYIEEANIGDIVIFRQAGAYCYGEGMINFLSHFLPDEIFINKEEN